MDDCAHVVDKRCFYPEPLGAYVLFFITNAPSIHVRIRPRGGIFLCNGFGLTPEFQSPYSYILSVISRFSFLVSSLAVWAVNSSGTNSRPSNRRCGSCLVLRRYENSCGCMFSLHTKSKMYPPNGNKYCLHLHLRRTNQLSRAR